ncbi:MAG: lamin tail domain-containing protein [Verrucomicrobiales bacterium]
MKKPVPFPWAAELAAVSVLMAGAATPTLAGPVISEIMYHPAHPDGGENPEAEWIEIHNSDSVAVDLTGWRIDEGVAFTFPAVSLQPGGFLVLAANRDLFLSEHGGNTIPYTVLGGWSGKLANGGEAIELVDASGARIDRVEYADEGDWAVRRRGPDDNGHRGWIWVAGHDGAGSSLELRSTVLSNDHGQNWGSSLEAGGTPGAPNSLAAANATPLIFDVRHLPEIPRSGDLVRVAARISDDGAPGAVTARARHRVSSANPGDFDSIDLRDDGTGGDEIAVDGIFTAMLPSRPNGTVVEFYLEAGDGVTSRTWPGPTDDTRAQGANLLYQVDDESNSGTMPIYRVVMTEEEDAEFDSLPFSFTNTTDAQFNATLVTRSSGGDFDIRYQCGVRLRGAGSRAHYPRNLRVNLPKDAPWESKTALNLNSQFSYLQHLGSEMFHRAGVSCFDAQPVQVRMNGFNHASSSAATPGNPFENHYGFYVHNEPLDGEFIEDHFPDDDQGNLYRKRGAGATDWRYFPDSSDLESDYSSERWEKKTNESEGDWSDLHEFLRVMNEASGSTYVDQVEAVMDVDWWLRVLAVHAILTNGENSLPTGVDDDYSLYRGANGRFRLLPHDLDTTFGMGDDSRIGINALPYTIMDFVDGGTNNNTISHLEPLFEIPAVVQRYYQHLEKLLDGPFAPSAFDTTVDRALAWVPESVRQGIKTFMNARRADIRNRINATLTVASNLTPQDGYDRTTSGAFTLTGRFNAAATTQVTVNGQPATLDRRGGAWMFSPGFIPLVNSGDPWLYEDSGVALPTAWNRPGFDDGSWASGPSPLGYGGDGEATEIAGGVNSHFTNYFRRRFTVASVAGISSLTLRFQRDDGIVLYLNGAEISRNNMPAGPIAHDTPANSNVIGAAESAWITIPVDKALLVDGINVLAAEVHQGDATSPDLRFNLDLEAESAVPFLLPGINRLVIEERDADGARLATTTRDVWFDDGTTGTVGGTMASNRTLTAAGGPWAVTSDIVVPAGVTLTIKPGTTLFFAARTGITVNSGGRLVCAGDPGRRIRLTRSPGATSTWDGLHFEAPSGSPSRTGNVVAYADMEWGDGGGDSIVCTRSRLLLDHVTWENCTTTVIVATNPQIEVLDCRFPSIPSSEVIHGNGLSGDEYFILRRNIFVPSSGYNDIIDFAGGRRPGPILTAYDNIFTGATDDCFDLDGTDAHLQGNIFMNVHLDQPRSSTSNAIATDNRSHITAVRNIFYDVDHAVLLGNEADCIFENNTVIGATIAAINFDEPERSGFVPGRRIDMDSNIFVDCAAMFAWETSTPPEPDPIIVGNRNIMPADKHHVGTGNIDADPFLAAPGGGPVPRENLALLPGSPAIGSGRNASDMGALVPSGANVSGLPEATTPLRDLVLTVDGPGITHFRWRLIRDDVPGAWSGDLALGIPISLSGLTDGSYRVELVARDSAGYWQAEAEATQSRGWTVEGNLMPSVRLNEILAAGDGGVDGIELFNPGVGPVDLSGWSLTDDPELPNKFVFGAGTVLAGGKYLHLPSNLTGILLDNNGEVVQLHRDRGIVLVDQIRFGLQLEGWTIGRTGPSAEWSLCTPTLGSANAVAATALADRIVVNEWLANTEIAHDEDLIELHNPLDAPAPLGGLWLSDRSDRPFVHQMTPLSFIAPNGFVVLHARGDAGTNAANLPFRLDAFYTWIVLTTNDGRTLDMVPVQSAPPDLSEGRNPDGSTNLSRFLLPTFGLSNNSSEDEIVTERATLVGFGHTWRYLSDATTDPPAGWHSQGFNDSAWPSGAGPLGHDTDIEGNANPATGSPPFFGTDFPGYRTTIRTYYFRTLFEFAGDAAEAMLRVAGYIDDGYVLYLNGQEIDRRNMPAGAPDYSTQASSSIGDAPLELGISVPKQALVSGTNVLAAEVHQRGPISSDVTFGLALDSIVTTIIPGETDPERQRMMDLIDYLRITEVMYNPANGTDYEFIELQNTSTTKTLNLDGVRFVEGITFAFPAMGLPPQAFVLVVSNQVAFESIYGKLNVAGHYSGKLDNGGEEIVLRLPAPYLANIQRFAYDDDWYPDSDANGMSLEILDRFASRTAWNLRAAWTSSSIVGGTPADSSASTGFPQWLAAYGLVEPDGDEDSDGAGNRLEYGLGLDPRLPDTAGLVLTDLTPSQHLRIGFAIPAHAPEDATYIVEAGDTLAPGSWTSIATRTGNGPWSGSAMVAEAPPSGGSVVTVLEDPEEAAAHGTRFLRLRVLTSQ